MKKIKKIINRITLGTIGMLPITIIAISCSTKEVKTLKANITTSWWKKKNKDKPNLISDYEDKFNAKLLSLKKADEKYKDVNTFELKIAEGADNGITQLNSVISGKSDFSIVNYTLFANDAMQNKMKPYFQTLTRAFFNDKLNASREEIKGFTNQINEYLEKNPYKTWTDEKQKWDGAKYEAMYASKNSLISTYRGMILISGTDADLIAIRKAWADKDWNTFVNFGILVGKDASQGKYKLPNKLLIEHFGDQADLNKNKENKRIKFGQESEKVRDVGKTTNFKIAFDDANSFAWTQNKVGEASSYTPTEADEKVEILTYTGQGLYDVGVFNPNYSKLEKELITQTFIALSKEGKDDFGTYSGYNGYEKITDIDQFFKDVK